MINIVIQQLRLQRDAIAASKKQNYYDLGHKCCHGWLIERATYTELESVINDLNRRYNIGFSPEYGPWASYLEDVFANDPNLKIIKKHVKGGAIASFVPENDQTRDWIEGWYAAINEVWDLVNADGSNS